MRDFRDAKAMAQTLRDALKAKSISVTHGESLELVARTLGFHDWNVLSAAIQSSRPTAAPPKKANAFSLKGAGIPITPMRDIVFFPQLISPIFVGRERTRRALAAAAAAEGRIVVLSQRRADEDDPELAGLYSVGVTADIIHYEQLPNGNLRVKVACAERVAVLRPVEAEFLAAEVAPVEELRPMDPQAFALMREILDTYQRYTRTAPPQSLYRYGNEPGVFADIVVQIIETRVERMQQVLEANDVVRRLEMILGWMKEPRTA